MHNPLAPLATALALVSFYVTAEEITLLTAGKPQLPILAPADSPAANELAEYLGRIAGSEFPRAGESSESGPAIFVGTQGDFPDLKIGIEGKLALEEFVIRSQRGSLYLIGGGEIGTSHAVATLLHDLGCRWFFPGKTWEVVPGKKEIKGDWDIQQKPDFPISRRIWYGFGAYAKNKKDWEDWNRHNRMGGPRPIGIGHTWAGLNPDRDFPEHPEWFALVDGKRTPSKPCYSHPEVIKRMTEMALKQAERGDECVSVSAPDGLGYCECEKCMAVFGGAEPEKAHSTLFATRKDGTLVNITSETLFAAVNEVAKTMAKKHPDVMLACYAYSAYSHPPSFDLQPNIYIQTTTAYRRTPLTMQEQLSRFGAKSSGLGVREYYSVYQWDWDWPDPGKMAPDILQKDLQFFHQNNVGAINGEASNNWAARGLGYYIAARLLWDVDSEVNPIIEDFYSKAFGPAAEPVERYYARWYGPGVVVSKNAEMPEQKKLFEKGMNADALRGAFTDLDNARRATTRDSDYRARVNDLCGYLHYLVLRYKVEQAVAAGKREGIVAAIREETEFGGRLSDTNMVHTRALIGKAFERRFRNLMPHLEGVDTKPWRKVGVPPDANEMDKLWEADRKLLGL